ncbi:hypothetical protein GCM10010399_63560 [Dactylosporangium fulvum]|uniref:RICIN domain-containing protein n=1 Tax=Dactylosporangium fulvum TaxID=53359 RepID=UPI0031D8109A
MMTTDLTDPLAIDLPDTEPSLVRPYVRLLAAHRSTGAHWDSTTTYVSRPEYYGRHARTPEDLRLTPFTRTRPAIEPPPVRYALPPGRSTRRTLAVGSTVLVLALSATALVLTAADPAAAPVRKGAESELAAPQVAQLRTAAAPVPAAPGTGAAPAQGAVPIEGEPVAVLRPATRTGRITGSAGLCLDGGRMRLSACDTSLGQVWTITGDGTVRTLGRCLQWTRSDTALADCDGRPPQRWQPGPGGALLNAASTQCLSVPDRRLPPRLTSCDLSEAQRWTLP